MFHDKKDKVGLGTMEGDLHDIGKNIVRLMLECGGFEVIDLELIQRVAATSKPIIMSTGMATLAEIDEAVSTIRRTRRERY